MGRQIKLTRTMLEQMKSYLEDRDESGQGWYYGNREQFEERHRAIKSWLKQEINKTAKTEKYGNVD